MREIKDIRARQYIASALLAIIAAAIIEWSFIYGIMKPNFAITEHPWRFFGAIISSLSGILLFSVPVLMRNEFDEGRKICVLLGLGVAVLFAVNDFLYYALIDQDPKVFEYLGWIVLEFLQYGTLGLVYHISMSSEKIRTYVQQF
jgi:hypothetical protein